MTTGLIEAFGFTESLTDVERALLTACSKSDIPSINEILENDQKGNIECVDSFNRTPLQVAVENEDIEATKLLMKKCGEKNIEDCLMLAIRLGSENMAISMLTHPRTDALLPRHTLSKMLVLASEMNMYGIVRHMVSHKGIIIQEPHPPDCSCCNASGKHVFQSTYERLNTYKGLASESYLNLFSKDPMLEALKLRKKILNLAEKEEYFKRDYTELAEKLSAFNVKLLSKVADDIELDTILNKVRGRYGGRKNRLETLRLAVIYQDKKLVAHPSCQIKLKEKLYEGFPALRNGSLFKRIAIAMLYVMIYPVLVPGYIFIPKSHCKPLQFMRAPMAKFIAHVYFHFLLMGQLLWIRESVSPYVIEDRIAWGNVSKENTTSYFRFHHDQNSILTRNSIGTFVYFIVFIWIIGLVWQQCNAVPRAGLRRYFKRFSIWIGIVMVIGYLTSYGFRFYAVFKTSKATNYFIQYQVYENRTLVSPVELLMAGNDIAVGHYYWLNPDRYSWKDFDAIIVSEGLFAVASVIDFLRIVRFLPFFQALGTLQISFGIMAKEIRRFSVLLLLLIAAFVLGLTNLYWFYSEENRKSVELFPHGAPVAEEHFHNIISAFKFCFWSLYGYGDGNATNVADYNENDFIRWLGYWVYGAYVFGSVIVLVNLFIAVLSLSYSVIQNDADTEWMYARTAMFFKYILPGSTLPVPLNLLLFPRQIICGVWSACKWLYRRNRKINPSNNPDGNREKPKTKETFKKKHERDKDTPNGHPGDDKLTSSSYEYSMVISRVVERCMIEAMKKK